MEHFYLLSEKKYNYFHFILLRSVPYHFYTDHWSGSRIWQKFATNQDPHNRIEDKNHINAESENAPAVILFFLILKLTVFQIYFVFFFFLRCFCYCMKKSLKSLRSGTGSNRGKFLVPDPNSMFLIHKTGYNSNLALYLICVQYLIHFRILYQKTVCTVHIS